MNLVFMTYNNYYNRIIKKFDTIAEYDAFIGSGGNIQEFYDIQFNPSDGVSTEQIVNWGNNTWTPDYLVVYDDTALPAAAIQSRWFVIEWVRTRTGQYKATLYRDVIADNYNTVIEAPMFIEKATVPFETDVAIYNTEDLQVNEIKQSEDLLKDKSNSAWLVGYFAKNTDLADNHIPIPSPALNPIIRNTLSAWEFLPYSNMASGTQEYYKVVKDFRIEMKCSLFPSLYVNATGTVDTDGNCSVGAGATVSYAAYCENVPTGHDTRVQWLRANISPVIVGLKSNMINYYKDPLNGYDFKWENDISALNNKYLFIETGADGGYYKITVNKLSNETDSGYYARNSAIETQFNTWMHTGTSKWNTNTAGGDSMANTGRYITYERYTITLTKVNPQDTYFDWPTAPKTLSDAPYGMFAIPFNAITIYKYSSEAGEDIPYLSTDAHPFSTNYICTIAEALSDNCYDIQLLPYCPILDWIDANNHLTLTGHTENVDYAFIKKNLGGGTIIDTSVVFFCGLSNFDFDIEKTLTIKRHIFDDRDDTLIEDMKIANQCDKYRLCSPNWSAFYDFSLIKAGGSISNFKIDCTYKPYMPYIHIMPDWSGLYGTDFDDYRGLICQGDFSVPRLKDKWKDYMINNKNFLNAFNREVEHLELTNEVQRTQQMISAAFGTAAGAGAGAIAGAKYGGGFGAAAGAVVGGTGSLIAGIADVALADTLRNEAVDYTKDLFAFNMQNIQARPDSLAKVSSFDKNNKVWPVLEYYSCTNQEKEALVNKMRYNGMTIGRIGKMSDFMVYGEPQYIKGQLIRNLIIADDYHILRAIAEELNKGVFI